ncbi:MAG: D-alanine--D-alanine ligase [Candidatus Omnitrophica bacterium]|nr:D-alanine--D-alanine ligase [Candidatus Omnitrophota bacterium]
MKDKKGRVVIVTGREHTPRPDMADILRCRDSVERALVKREWEVETIYFCEDDFSDTRMIRKILKVHNPVCIFNLFEGFALDSRKEVEFARILGELGIPFTGNEAEALENCLDKNRMKSLLQKEGILVPEGIYIKGIDEIQTGSLHFPLFVKPCFEDGSVGIENDSLVRTEEELRGVCERRLREFPAGVIIEEFIGGTEYITGGLGRWPYELLGISVIEHRQDPAVPQFLSYSAKWDRSSKEYRTIVPHKKRLGAELEKKITDVVRSAGKGLGLAGYFRVDVREQGGNVYVLDGNPNPDINTDSGFIKQASSKGYPYEVIIERIVREALWKQSK